MTVELLASGEGIGLRNIEPRDFETLANFEYSVSIVDSHSNVAKLGVLHEQQAIVGK